MNQNDLADIDFSCRLPREQVLRLELLPISNLQWSQHPDDMADIFPGGRDAWIEVGRLLADRSELCPETGEIDWIYIDDLIYAPKEAYLKLLDEWQAQQVQPLTWNPFQRLR